MITLLIYLGSALIRFFRYSAFTSPRVCLALARVVLT